MTADFDGGCYHITACDQGAAPCPACREEELHRARCRMDGPGERGEE